MHDVETIYWEKGASVNSSRSRFVFTRMSNEKRDGAAGTVRPAYSPNEPVVTPEVTVRHRVAGDNFDRSVSVTVVEALAEAEGVSPLDMESRLYEAVDPDALDQLLSSNGTTLRNGRVEFSVSGFQVSVTVDDHVSVCVYE